MAQFYNYKDKISYTDLNYSCKKCDWSGTGGDAAEDLGTSYGFAILCPKCSDYLDWIDGTVSLDELFEYGTEKDKEFARQRQDFLDRLWAAELKDPDLLPDIESDEIIISLREEGDAYSSDGAIVLYWNDMEIWREVRSFEYYPRYLELGEILKEKYGDRLVDFEAKRTVHLGGDCFSAFDKVDNFRKTLKRMKSKEKTLAECDPDEILCIELWDMLNHPL